MTRATKSPVKRLVEAPDRFGVREFVVTVEGRLLHIRPKGTRSDGPQAMSVPYGPLYQRLVEAAVAARRTRRRRP